MDCITNGCDYTRLGTSCLRKGRDWMATVNDTGNADSNVFFISDKKYIFVNSFLVAYNTALYYL